MNPSFRPSSSSMLPRGLKQKRLNFGTGDPPTVMLIHMGYTYLFLRPASPYYYIILRIH